MLKFIRTLRKIKSPLFDTRHSICFSSKRILIGTTDGTLAISRYWLIGFSTTILSRILSTGTPISNMKNIVFFVPDTKDSTLILILVSHLISTQKMKLLLLFLPRLFLLLIPLVLQQMQFFLLFTKLLLLLQFQP
jgi:hypothetical protein